MDLLRAAVRAYEDIWATTRTTKGKLYRGRPLRTLAARGFDALGGQPEPAFRSLKDYESDRFGPYLGVSGEPSAAPAIRNAALNSAKAVALGLTDPLDLGVAHDAERLGSVGELPVGPDEYRAIRLDGMGRIMTSTNIGSRANVRLYGRIATLWVDPASRRRMTAVALQSARERLLPFLETPDGHARPATIYVQFRQAVGVGDRRHVLRALVDAIAKGQIGVASVHRIALVAKVGRGASGLKDAIAALRLAGSVGVRRIAIEGTVRTASTEVISDPGLLQYFNVSELNQLLAASQGLHVSVGARDTVDAESVARLVWANLHAARAMGLELGKYGLFPLTFSESETVISSIQKWFRHWTAAPVFYVDIPLVLAGEVIPTRRVGEALRLWLKMVSRSRVPIVLVDTVLKSRGRRLIKMGPRDREGFFSMPQIGTLDAYARRLGVRVLWAGGITAAQAFALGELGVFGLYVTSAVARPRPIGPGHQMDPALASERVPIASRVSSVKLLVEAGFVLGRLRGIGREVDAGEMRDLAERVLTASAEISSSSQRALRVAVMKGWRTLARS